MSGRMTAFVNAAAGIMGLLAAAGAHAQDSGFGPPALIEAAKKEGGITVYTTLVIENEHDMLKHFSKRFPFLRVGFVRAPGGQLITRIKTEAANGKLAADVINLSDRGLAAEIADLFADYAPPNAVDYPAGSVTAGKLWPRATIAWCIGYNKALVGASVPRSWMDLTNPIYAGKLGEVIILSGGSTWIRAMFQRQVLGESYWAALAKNRPTLYPSSAPATDALVRGEITVLAGLSNVIFPKAWQGAPIDCTFPPEGVPLFPLADGVTKTAAAPNAARLFLNWSLSTEAQAIAVAEQGFFSSLGTAPMPKGADPSTLKIWLPDPNDVDRLRAAWTAEWNQTFGYRQ